MADGEVVYEVRADTSKVGEDLKKSNAKVEKSAEDTAKKVEEANKKAAEEAKKANKKAADEIREGFRQLGENAVNTAKTIGTSFLTVTTAASVVSGAAIKLSNDFDKAMNGLSASTGLAKEDMEQYQGVLENIYANNYGENFEDIATAMGEVRKNLGNLSKDDLQEVTESAFVLRDQFQYEIPESVRAAKAMMESFGTSGEDAMNLIAAGSQNGLDFSGELIDSISEYSSQFEKLGFNADDMFKIFQKGTDSGAFNLDSIGDAIKEISLTSIDGSKTTQEAFTAMGFDADDMASKFAQGGDTAKQAFKDTVKALSEMEDPLAQNTAGVSLFHGLWENLGPEAVTALADIEDGAYDTGDALNQMKDVKYDDIGSAIEGLKRNFELLIQPIGDALIPLIEKIVNEMLPQMQTTLQPVIDKIIGFMPTIFTLVEGILPQLIGLVAAIAVNFLDVATKLMPSLTNAINELMPLIMTVVSGLLPPLVELLTNLMPLLLDIAAQLMPPLIDVFKALLPIILDLIDQLLPPLMSLLESLMPCIEALTPLIATLAEMFAEKLQQAINNIMPVVESAIGIFTNLIDFITNVFQGNWEAAWDNVVGYFRSIFETVSNVAAMAINNVVDTINSMLGGINNVTAKVGIPAIPEIPHVPTFHVGGIVDFDKSEGMALLKNGEMVLTAKQQKQLFDIANGMVSPTMSGNVGNNISNNNKQTTITNNYSFSVRDDMDTQKISQELAKLQSRELMAIGGKK